MTIWKGGLPQVRLSASPPSPSKVMPMAHHIRSRVPTPRNSQADIRTGPLKAALATICRRKPRKPSPRQSSKSTAIESARIALQAVAKVRGGDADGLAETGGEGREGFIVDGERDAGAAQPPIGQEYSNRRQRHLSELTAPQLSAKELVSQ